MPKNLTMRMSHRDAWHATEWIQKSVLPPPLTPTGYRKP